MGNVTAKIVNRYFELGIVVHPLCPAHHKCNSPGKIPFDPVTGQHMTGWQRHEQFHMDHWREWLDYDSSINIGMLTGSPSNIVGIDIDDDGGDEMVERLRYPTTWAYSTGRGRRLLFRCTEPVSRTRLADPQGRSVERLGDATNNVLPPSEHVSGRSYAWIPGLTPKDIPELPKAPPWVYAAGAGTEQAAQSAPGLDREINSDEIDWAKFAMQQLREGQRNEAFTRLAGRFFGLAPLTRREVYFICRTINEKYGQPPLPEGELKNIVRSIERAEWKNRQNGSADMWDKKNEHNISPDLAAHITRKARKR